MYVAVIEVDSSTTPHVVLGQTVQGVNRRGAEILTAAYSLDPAVQQFVQHRPAPTGRPRRTGHLAPGLP